MKIGTEIYKNMNTFRHLKIYSIRKKKRKKKKIIIISETKVDSTLEKN